MQKKFGLVTGLSDHTIDNTPAIFRVSLDPAIIEKHVTLDCNGSVDYGLKSSEQGDVKFRRSLYFVKNIKKGDTITERHVRSIRRGFGLSPKCLEDIIGRKVNKNKSMGEPTISTDIMGFVLVKKNYLYSRRSFRSI